MPRLLYFAIPLFLFCSGLAAEQETPSAFDQRGYLDDGQLLAGETENWKELVDTLSRLDFNYIATRGVEPAQAVLDYLQKQGLTVQNVAFPGELEQEGADKPLLQVVGSKEQKLWAGGMLTPPQKGTLLWADDGSGRIAGWPLDTKGVELGVFLHAGGKHNGPVQDPYPAIIGESIRDAAKRGLTANALFAGPGIEPFLLNLEAAVAAMNNPQGFDADSFYAQWASRHFGERAAGLTVKSLKLLHGAHEQVGGFADIAAKSSEILATLQQEKPEGIDLNPVNDALRLSRRSLELANTAGEKVPSGQRETFKHQILLPAELYLQNLELLETLCKLSGAWKIYRAMPPSPVSQQRVAGLLAEAQGRAAILPNTTGIHVPNPEDIETLAKKL